jgi:hypothetical protein
MSDLMWYPPDDPDEHAHADRFVPPPTPRRDDPNVDLYSPCQIRWSRTFGYIACQDPETHEWHEIPKDQAPRGWRWIAQRVKLREEALRRKR